MMPIMAFLRIMHWVALVGFGVLCATTSSWAAERVFLGDTLASPLAASADPHTTQTLNTLRQKVASSGTVRIIVKVRVLTLKEERMLILRRDGGLPPIPLPPLSFWARFRLCAIAFLLLPVAMSAAAQVPFLTTQMLAQASIGGRADRTPAEEKLDSTLMFALRSLAGAQGKVPLLQQPGIQSFISQNVAADQTIFVVIKAKVSPDLVK